jgi:hypothetical protein
LIIPDRLAEIQEDLRRLAVDPTSEGIQQVLEDWDERQQMYDNTTTGWSRASSQGDTHAG